MHILTRWNYRMVRANRSRTITVFLAVVGFFALWVCADFVATTAVHSSGVTESSSGISVKITMYMHYFGFFGGLRFWLRALISGFFSGTLFNNGFYRAMISYLSFGLMLIMAAVLYSVFSVTANECLQDHHILHSCGATARQIRAALLRLAIALDLIGAAVGIAVGLLAARLSVGPAPFRAELFQFFGDSRTRLILTGGLLLPPCLMLLASLFAFRRKRSVKPPRTPKRGMFRRSLTRRVFGAGGVLGRMNAKKSRRYRVIFSLTFAVCLIVLAFQETILLRIDAADPVLPGADLRIVCRNTGIRTQSGTDALDALIRENAERFEIKNEKTYFVPMPWYKCCYFLLNSDWSAGESNRFASKPFAFGGRSVQLYRGEIEFGFLDDATFERYAAENNIQTEPDGAILYNMDYRGNKTLQTVDPQESVTLHFVPRSFLYDAWIVADGKPTEGMSPVWNQPYSDFLRDADPVSVTKPIRILGLTETPPDNLDLDFNWPTLLFPERTLASFRSLLSDVPTAPTIYADETDWAVKQYYFDLTYSKTDADAFLEAIYMDPHFLVNIEEFGIGSREFGTAGYASGDPDEDNIPLAEIDYYDLNTQRDRLALFQSTIPKMQVILLATVAWTLFVGVLNTAHMNRMTRRREKAVLESVGMGRRQKTGMLLYESARYALGSALLGLLGFLLVFFPIWRDVQNLLWSNDLAMQGNRIIVQDITWNGTAADWLRYLQAFGEACAQVWWVFAVGAALIFVLLVATDQVIERRSRREDLIQILKDDYATDDFI